MSTHPEHTHETADPEYDCATDGCDNTFRESVGVRGSYCSLDCFHRDKGRSALTNIAHDHRFCSSCFRIRKEIDYPPESFIAERSKLVGESLIGEEELTPQMSAESGIVFCSCGTIDHDARDETLRNIDRDESVANLFGLLVQLADESQLPNSPTRSQYTAALERSDFDWELSAGAAVYE